MIQTGFGERKVGKPQRPRYLDLHKPLGTIVSGGSKHGLITAFLSKHYGGPNGNSGGPGLSMRQPLGAVTSRDSTGLTTVSVGGDPRRTKLVAAFITKYYGQGGRWSGLGEPVHTIVTKARMGLVTITLEGEEYAITDIGMRMLQPRELARAQGFQDDYVITGTKSQQIARIGNSVPPPMVEAIVKAQFTTNYSQIRRVG
jgi:DNA (cytosine-5)-methyltransferase 1